ncbi:MAG: acetylxylan esterase [Candidatus Methylacidiphilales bacterium]
MTTNLATPYKPEPSQPRKEGISFYAPGCDDFLFDTSHVLPHMVCLPHKRAIALEWSLHHNTVRHPMTTGAARPRYDNSFAIPLPCPDLAPGFYDLRVRISLTAETTLEGTTTFGWRMADMPVYPSEPADFDAFWQRALAELDKTAPEPVCVLDRVLRGKEIDSYNMNSAALPENYDPAGARTDAIEIYRVSFKSLGGVQVYGWYAKPVGEGPFPTLLVLPGAGNGARPAPAEHARHGYAALDIQVHGNPVDAETYAALLPDNSADPTQRTHYGVYLNALQAARAVRLLPHADPARLAVLGGSQGGRLSVVVAALDSGMKAAIPAITHFAYRPWSWWVEQLNREAASGGTVGSSFSGQLPPKEAAANPSDLYFDVLNFAPRIQCPVLMNAGLTDPVSPAMGIFALYQRLTSPRQIIPLPNTAHDWAPAFDTAAWKWLQSVVG